MAATIEFLNHASVLIEAGEASVVSDPWYQGAVFNRGWDLIHEDPSLAEIAARARHVWISHEHPDHFSPDVFKARPPEGARVLFQATRDRRVAGFLEAAGWPVREVAEGEAVALGGGASLTVGRNGFYDSWSLFRGDGVAILNLNDCEFRDPAALRRLRDLVGPIDVLMSQFSYAAWKGGRDTPALARAAARDKLDALALQARLLAPRWVIPFASFARFSHVENAYLNGAANPVEAILGVLPAGCDAVVMAPRDRWTVGEAWDNGRPLAFWREKAAGIGQAPLHPVGPAVGVARLAELAEVWRTRLFAANSRGAMALVSRLPGLGALRPVRVRLTDLGTVVEVGPLAPLRELGPAAGWDAAMASESLAFVFAHDFGYDTLTVNGRFDASPEGFARMTKSFALGSLNTLGLSLGPALLRRPDVVFMLARRLGAFLRRLKESL
jgi:hypothetical protein